MSLTHGSKPSNTQPRKDPSKLTKGEKRLKRRVEAWNQHGKNPMAPNNPSNPSGQGHDMHKPGSKKK